MPRAYYLGDDAESVAKEMWPDCDVAELTPDATDADRILIHKFLQYLPFMSALDIIKRAAAVLRPGGTLTVTVPSLDWAAREMCKAEVPETVWVAIYGAEGLPHLSGYSVQRLRSVLGSGGLAVVEASTITESLVLVGPDGKDAPAPYCLAAVTGVKVNGLDT